MQNEHLRRPELLHDYRVHARRSDPNTRAIVQDGAHDHNPQLALRPIGSADSTPFNNAEIVRADAHDVAGVQLPAAPELRLTVDGHVTAGDQGLGLRPTRDSAGKLE